MEQEHTDDKLLNIQADDIINQADLNARKEFHEIQEGEWVDYKRISQLHDQMIDHLQKARANNSKLYIYPD